MTQVKCVFPGCKVVGDGVVGRPYACEMHTAWIVTGYRGVKGLVAESVKRALTKKVPWWAKAFVEGMKDAG